MRDKSDKKERDRLLLSEVGLSMGTSPRQEGPDVPSELGTLN